MEDNVQEKMRTTGPMYALSNTTWKQKSPMTDQHWSESFIHQTAEVQVRAAAAETAHAHNSGKNIASTPMRRKPISGMHGMNSGESCEAVLNNMVLKWPQSILHAKRWKKYREREREKKKKRERERESERASERCRKPT